MIARFGKPRIHITGGLIESTIGRAMRLGQVAYHVARHGVPDWLLHYGLSPGDSLLCTPLFRALRSKGAGKLWMMTNFPDLFEGNPDIDHVVPYDCAFPNALAKLGAKVVHPSYGAYIAELDRTEPPDDHIIRKMAQHVRVSDCVELRPHVCLSEQELKSGHYGARQIAIQSTAAGARLSMKNKEWFLDRFQEVVHRLSDEFTFAQLGNASDPLLNKVIDLRGKTSIRQSASVLNASLCFVGLVGFLMHLARAVDCPAVIIYGGRERPDQSGYSCNENLYTPLPCAPCWLWNTCAFDHRCMREINPGQVISSIERIVAHRATGGRGERKADAI